MNTKFTGSCIGVMVVGMFVTAFIAYPHLPLTMASHWDISGNVNGTLPRVWATFMLPSIVLLLWGLWALLPNIDPIAKGFKGFRFVYDFFWILLTAFFAYVYALSLEANLGITVNMSQSLLVSFGLLIVILGALLPRIGRNWFFGIRTPWTLSSDTVWKKTHKLASPLFMLAGLMTFLAAFNPSSTVVLWAFFGPLVLAILVTVVYSYVLYKRERRH